MVAAPQPSVAESLTDLWALLYRGTAIAVHDCEIHCLTSIALAADDDLIAHLLLRKLRIARKVGDGDPDPIAVRMNSLVVFTHGTSERRFCRIIHPRAAGMTSDGLGIDNPVGAGLIGLRAAQSILWPDMNGSLSELEVLDVRNGPDRRRAPQAVRTGAHLTPAPAAAGFSSPRRHVHVEA